MKQTITYRLSQYSRDELIDFAKELIARCEFYESRMLTKAEVAERAGMTVSWLDNSGSPTAVALRGIGVRYGAGRTSPIRFPQHRVMAICALGEHQ